MKTWRRIVGVAVIGWLLAGLCMAAERTRSGLAIAYLVSGIQIDGDLSDWPVDLPRYPITFRFQGEAPTDPRDCSAEFRAGYNEVENALYVAVEIQDEDRAAVSNLPVARFTNEMTYVTIGIDTVAGGHVRFGCRRGESISNTVLLQGRL